MLLVCQTKRSSEKYLWETPPPVDLIEQGEAQMQAVRPRDAALCFCICLIIIRKNGDGGKGGKGKEGKNCMDKGRKRKGHAPSLFFLSP